MEAGIEAARAAPGSRPRSVRSSAASPSPSSSYATPPHGIHSGAGPCANGNAGVTADAVSTAATCSGPCIRAGGAAGWAEFDGCPAPGGGGVGAAVAAGACCGAASVSHCSTCSTCATAIGAVVCSGDAGNDAAADITWSLGGRCSTGTAAACSAPGAAATSGVAAGCADAIAKLGGAAATATAGLAHSLPVAASLAGAGTAVTGVAWLTAACCPAAGVAIVSAFAETGWAAAASPLPESPAAAAIEEGCGAAASGAVLSCAVQGCAAAGAETCGSTEPPVASGGRTATG